MSSQIFAVRGRVTGALIARCCCNCHTRLSSVRALSSSKGLAQKENDDCPLADGHPLWPMQLRCFSSSTHSSVFKSNNLLRPGNLSATVLSGRTGQTFLSGHTPFICDASTGFHQCFVASCYHTSPSWLKEESKVEKSVKALKESIVKEEKVVEPIAPAPEVAKVEPTTAAAIVKNLWQRVVAELVHYYHGFRLLFIDIKICSRLLWNILMGKSLTRRERRQMVRTAADLFRLLPFSVFIIVPFMEFLLPVAIKLFPNMLPSTFKDSKTEQEKMKKNLKVKLEMAKFLQETLHQTALQKKKKTTASAVEEFSQFVEKIRSQGIRPSTKEIVKFAKLFENEITLDNMSRQQLMALCRVLNIHPIGIDPLLRFQLDMKLRQLKADDVMIMKEGIDSLSMAELQAANRARGQRALGVSEERLKEQLQQWLTLHLEERIPTSLLLLSRALYLPETLSSEEQLEKTITHMVQTAPTTTTEVKLKAAELVGEEVDNKTRLEIIKHEEQIIKEESKARQAEEAALKEEKARHMQQEREAAEAVAGEAVMNVQVEGRDTAPIITPSKAEVLVDKAPVLKGLAGEELEKKKEEEEEEHITSKELEDIESALEEIAEHKQLNIEKEELQDLKEDVNEYKEDLQDLKQVMVLGGVEQDTIVESKAAKRLAKRVDRLIQQADAVMNELQAEKEKVQEDMEVTEVRLKRSAELREDERRAEEVMKKISEQKDNIVSINEMLLALKRLQKVPNETKLQRIIEVLDDDHDGNININLALKVLEVLGQENVKLNKVQVVEMINLLKAEMELEEEEKMKEKIEKSTHKSDSDKQPVPPEQKKEKAEQ